MGRWLLLATAAAGKSLPNIEDLAGPCTYARAHNFRAIILSGIARGARSSSTKERERVPCELLPWCSRSGTPVELFLEVPRSRLLDRQISLSEWLPTDEPCCRRRQRGGRPLPCSIRTLVLVSEQVLLALARDWWRERVNLDNFQRFHPRKPLLHEALPNFGLVTS